MGLLDEAIREHLELKRRRGGDPTEIAREEREALEPIFPVPAGPGEEAAPGGEDLDHEDALAAPEPQELPVAEPGLESPFAAEEFSSVGQETAEIDMQAVLEADELDSREQMLTDEHRMPGGAAPSA
jgi:hypothetical protein